MVLELAVDASHLNYSVNIVQLLATSAGDIDAFDMFVLRVLKISKLF